MAEKIHNLAISVRQPFAEQIMLGTKKIEGIINDKLPKSAYEYQAWWLEKSQGSHVQSNTWLNAGWRVDTVNLQEKWVRFIRA